MNNARSTFYTRSVAVAAMVLVVTLDERYVSLQIVFQGQLDGAYDCCFWSTVVYLDTADTLTTPGKAKMLHVKFTMNSMPYA